MVNNNVTVGKEEPAMSDRSSSELVTQLKVISHIREGDRVRVEGSRIRIDPPSRLQFIFRFFSCENRANGLLLIQEIIRRAMAHAAQLRAAGDSPAARRMAGALRGAKTGLSNLCATYGDDANMVASLESVVDDIDDCVAAPAVPSLLEQID